ncbi:MAG: YidC/Oxa1 family membrane protein insertase [Actinobacteria bacterium]|nr:YidC/Oxa1 family membrane protein insertase [Actinomycetota bacterium]
MFSLLAGVLAFWYDLIPNYLFAIAMLTLTVMAVLAPITLKGTRSMLAMQKLQPEMKRIQEMHKGDRQAANEAMMAFYKEHKINPLSGCLPMLAQFPVLIVMFRVINGLVKHKGGVGTPSYLSHDSALYRALQESGGKMKSFGVDFGATPSNAGRGAVVLYMLIVLVVLTSYYQVRQMTSRNSQANANPQMQMMNRITPLFSGLISLSLPGAVTLYFLVSNLFRVTQQGLMYRFDPHLRAHAEEVREVRSKAADQPQEPRKGLFASIREQAETTRGNGNGASKQPTNGSRGANGGLPKPTSGRVTQPGRQNNASRKRSKKKR